MQNHAGTKRKVSKVSFKPLAVRSRETLSMSFLIIFEYEFTCLNILEYSMAFPCLFMSSPTSPNMKGVRSTASLQHPLALAIPSHACVFFCVFVRHHCKLRLVRHVFTIFQLPVLGGRPVHRSTTKTGCTKPNFTLEVLAQEDLTTLVLLLATDFLAF